MNGTRDSCVTLFILAVLLALMFFPAFSLGLDYPPGFKFTEVPAPLSGDNPRYPLVSMSVPNVGQSFFDQRFGTVLTRTTPTGWRQEYSRFDPFNADRSMILLLMLGGGGEWRIYRTSSLPYVQAGNLVRSINNLEEMRWDPVNPKLLWGTREFSLITLDVETGVEVVVKNFQTDPAIAPILAANPLIYRITMKDEGESSRDKRFWAFILQNGDDPAHPNWSYLPKFLFCWDRQQNKVLGTYQLPLDQAANIDWVGMSPLGNWVIIGGEPNQGSWSAGGLIMANKEFTSFHTLAYATAHSDVGLDSQGKEVIVMQNSQTDYIDLIPIDPNSKVVRSVGDYANNIVQPLVRLYYDNTSPIGLNSGVHISCNYPGYCLVSTNTEPNLPEQNWLDRTITLVRLDRNKPRVFYLAKVYNTTGHYWEETQATISNDGSRVVWGDNWGQSAPEGQPSNTFLLQLDMPPEWQSKISPAPVAPASLLLGD
jgi:hypothetical protein